MTLDAQAGGERVWRFRDAVLPHIDDAYTFANFLMRNPIAADEAVRECYLRALRQVDGFRDRAIKPWLFAILRNVCEARLPGEAKLPRNATSAGPVDEATEAAAGPMPETTDASDVSGRPDSALMRRIVIDLPTPLREVIVLRELCGMSYGEISEVAGVPIGTVVSRIAGARAMMLVAWKTAARSAQRRPTSSARGDVDRQAGLRLMDGSRNSASGANR